jgi:hypothetical protein
MLTSAPDAICASPYGLGSERVRTPSTVRLDSDRPSSPSGRDGRLQEQRSEREQIGRLAQETIDAQEREIGVMRLHAAATRTCTGWWRRGSESREEWGSGKALMLQ